LRRTCRSAVNVIISAYAAEPTNSKTAEIAVRAVGMLKRVIWEIPDLWAERPLTVIRKVQLPFSDRPLANEDVGQTRSQNAGFRPQSRSVMAFGRFAPR